MFWSRIGLITIVVAVAVKIIVPYIAHKLLFIPDTNISIVSDDIEIITPSGINAMFYDKGSNTPIIIHSPGNAGNIYNRLHLAYHLKDIQVSLLIYDYRGFGNSPGIATTNNIIEDGEQVYNYVRSTYPNRKIILWGESMGSAVAWHLAAKYDVLGLIITSGYASLAEVISGLVFPCLGEALSYLMFLPDNIVHASKIRCPVLFLHAGDDTLITISHAEKLRGLIPTNSIFITTHGGHNFDISKHVSEIKDYLQSLN
jgi:uncharacterized protein